mgnify:CR=1 FL=1
MSGSKSLQGRTWPIHLLLIVAVLVIIGPVMYAVLVSTQSNNQFNAHQLRPGGLLRSNFDTVWNKRGLGGFMLNSLLVASIIAIVKAITAVLAGMAFVYFRFPGKWLVFGFVLVTLLMPTEISILALFRQVSDLGWIKPVGFLPPLGLIVPFFASATGAFLFRQHFASLPAELSEAAQIDGIKPWQFLFKVLIPLSWNAIGALIVIQFIYGWNMYAWPQLLIPDGANQVVQVGLGSLINADQAQAYGPLMLGAVVASIPPIIVFLVLQKALMSGMAVGRDK